MTTTIRARAALAEIRALGLTIDDLLAVDEPTADQPIGPTFAEYLPTVVSGYEARSQRAYGSYWRLRADDRRAPAGPDHLR